ncbi:hypothetical protein LMH87_005917 [Akanthomyces muscarius]|uniref:DNA polymerase lambda n=1 Tax=Akanthomyces muscarius TaxID=2231603 RepID=A0A9W8QMC1_AKAMU|nr:hypothetical protein LMH87_005917 [Akanthomyces muscarius]KAJ4164234.1 hypothetical protein LMH87_005917 [Akanthomyces muscarius]
MAQQQPSLEAKRAFFTHFKTLPHSDDEDDVGSGSAEGQSDEDVLDPREQRMRQRHRRFFRKTSPRPMPDDVPPLEKADNKSNGPPDTVQATPEDDAVVVTSSARATPVSKKPTKASSKRHRNVVDDLLEADGDDEVEIIGETPIDTTKRQRSSAKITTSIPMTKRIPPKLASSSSLLRVGATLASAASTTKKRKKDEQVTLRPEGEQIFKGLIFYYIPDNEIAPARRLRIQKAREYGAVRTSDAAEATHVIVDRDIVYKDAKKVVATMRGERRVNGVVVVSEDYPIECVQFKALLDWKQKRYRLAEQPEDDVTHSETIQMEKKDKEVKSNVNLKEKLQLKEPQQNPKKWDYAPKSTPPNASDESPGIDSQPIMLDAATASEGGHDQEAARAESVQRDSIAPGDELSEMIDMMQEFKDLPLDHDDEDETTTAAVPESGSDNDQESQRKAPATKKASAGAFEERFACARSGPLDAHTANPNARTVEVLQSMLAYYERISDQWRVLAYRKAIATLKRQPVRVASEQDALRLPGVGPRLAAKIEEIATTDRLRRLEYAEQDGSDAVLKLFLGIYGVGPALAAQWAARGMRTFEDVQSQVRLTPGQKMGMERYRDLNTKIPRDEVEALAQVVRDAAAQVDGAVELTVGGSYRRGAPASSDVDFIVTKANTASEAELVPFLRELVSRLQACQFLVATLAADGNIWQGCCVLPRGSGVWRRVDFLLVPATQMGAALIYFTGDDVFNRSLRLLAQKKGMKLNQRGLYRRVGGRELRTTEEDLIEGASERRIFEILGVSWREPTQRWC